MRSALEHISWHYSLGKGEFRIRPDPCNEALRYGLRHEGSVAQILL